MDLPRTAVRHFSLVLGYSTPAKSENLRKIDKPLAPPPKKNQYFFFIFLFTVQEHCDGELLFFFPFDSLNIPRYGWKTF
jgi:hypothetical protein